jgi:S-adenosylmethionine-diacylglycerol 3-amino-3-carboxypropyl transferase
VRSASPSSPAGPSAPCAADFSGIRYAQCWEDADVLLEALDPRPGETVLSICSAGDNTLSLLSRGPARVVALDLSPAQLRCLELRVAAYRELDHAGLLELLGSRPSARRAALYARCRPALSAAAQAFWDGRAAELQAGLGAAGRFERYFRLFRRRVLPLIHGRRTVEALLAGGPPEARRRFYAERWDGWRWRLLFALFFSRLAMGRLGRDPEFFRHVDGAVAARILARTRHALTALDPARNPYLHWILAGTHGAALPHALRPESFDPIRAHLDRLEWHERSLEECLAPGRSPLDALRASGARLDKANLSDVFEYMDEARYGRLLELLVAASRPGGRLAYWNLLAPRRRPAALADRLRPLEPLAARLHAEDKAFFYGAFVVEEVA